MTTNDNKNLGDYGDNFNCRLCYVICSCTADWNRHVKTKKHNNNKMTTKISAITAITAIPNDSHYDCVCGKKYSDRICLWRHKKKCKFDSNGNEHFLTSMIIDIVKSNNVIQQQMMDMCKNGINSNNTTKFEQQDLQFECVSE
jgi:hypothetical protein